MDGMTIAVMREGLDVVTEAVLSKLQQIAWCRWLEHWVFLEICRSDERERGDPHTLADPIPGTGHRSVKCKAAAIGHRRHCLRRPSLRHGVVAGIAVTNRCLDQSRLRQSRPPVARA